MKDVLLPCPFCGNDAHHTIGDKSIRQYDVVSCIKCDVYLEGDYEPYSAFKKWNIRVIKTEV